MFLTALPGCGPEGGSLRAEPRDDRLVHGLGPGAQPNAGPGHPVHPVALVRPGTSSGRHFGVRARHRIGDLDAGGSARSLGAVRVFTAFAIVKYCGAAYLVYLGIAGFLSGGLAGSGGRTVTGRRRSLAAAYWQGLLTDLLNPKLLLFFFSFLPQFVDPARGEPSLQMLVPRAVVPGHRRADQSGGGAWRRNARRADRAPPVLGRCSALVFERGLDRARYPAGVERPSLTG
jgi:LysE type translocator